MKRLFFYSIFLLSGLIVACSGNNEPELPISKPEPPENNKPAPPVLDASLYTIILKDSIGEDLLNNETIGSYFIQTIKIISLSKNITSISYKVNDDYPNENRLSVKVDIDKKVDSCTVETILSLHQQTAGCDRPDIYTYDTIRCDINVENSAIVCKNIWIGNQLMWAEKDTTEKPYFTLIKKYCNYGIACTPDIYD